MLEKPRYRVTEFLLDLIKIEFVVTIVLHYHLIILHHARKSGQVGRNWLSSAAAIMVLDSQQRPDQNQRPKETVPLQDMMVRSHISLSRYLNNEIFYKSGEGKCY